MSSKINGKCNISVISCHFISKIPGFVTKIFKCPWKATALEVTGVKNMNNGENNYYYSLLLLWTGLV